MKNRNEDVFRTVVSVVAIMSLMVVLLTALIVGRVVVFSAAPQRLELQVKPK